MPAPVIKHAMRPDGTLYAWRHKDGDLRPMMIDQDLLDAYRGDGDDVVYFPLRLLQHAESRFSVILMMRILGWAIGDYDKRNRIRRDGTSLTLRFSVPEWLEIVGDTGRTWNKRLVDAILTPAAEEITSFTDWQVKIRPRVAHTGRIRDIEIVIVDPVDDPAFDDRAIEARSTSWRPASRPSREHKKAPAQAGSAIPVTVSKTALDNAVPLSRLSPDSQ
jgi:hypothetical protein